MGLKGEWEGYTPYTPWCVFAVYVSYNMDISTEDIESKILVTAFEDRRLLQILPHILKELKEFMKFNITEKTQNYIAISILLSGFMMIYRVTRGKLTHEEGGGVDTTHRYVLKLY